jgi:hypothetical protein
VLFEELAKGMVEVELEHCFCSSSLSALTQQQVLLEQTWQPANWQLH